MWARVRQYWEGGGCPARDTKVSTSCLCSAVLVQLIPHPPHNSLLFSWKLPKSLFGQTMSRVRNKFGLDLVLILFLLWTTNNADLTYRRRFNLKHLTTAKCLVGHRGATFIDFCDTTDKFQEWVTLGPQWGGTIRPFLSQEMCLASPPEGSGFYTHLQNCSQKQCLSSFKWTITLDPRPSPAPSLSKVVVWNNDLERCLQPSGGYGDRVKTGPCPKHDGWVRIDRGTSDSFFWEVALIKETV
ncbi:uncharacterized protein LOC118433741 [Folsomia candida]|uniref:uncharacterized protein LOC118433741 n=1 Tax=Folsomia candida TaxID=158441 RepID=UPI001605309C|nr:uncharacterized protein LOC118433741 [Folsomia candida]